MAYTAEQPEFVIRKRVDKRGRLYIGQDYADQELILCVEVPDDGS